MRELTAFQRDILYAVADQDPPYGLAIKRDLEEYYGEEVNHGRLYPNLDELVDDGFLRKGELDKRTNFYELTDKARRALAKRREWEDDHVDVEEEAETAIDAGAVGA